jgi:Fungal protein kinase
MLLFRASSFPQNLPPQVSVTTQQLIILLMYMQEDLILGLIGALQTLPATRLLRSRINRKAQLRSDLFSLGSKVGTVDLDIKSTIPLVELVVDNAPDVEIWRAVFNLVALANQKQSTPLIASENAILDTPLPSSSASQTANEVDQRILEELTGHVYYDVGGFFERYFEEKTWSNRAGEIYEESRAQYADGRWSGWPEPSIQGPFFEWFMKLQDTLFSRLHHRYYTSANRALRGLEADRKLDIFLTPADAALPDSEYDWSNVLVIGEHKQNPDEDHSPKTLVQLAGYAREVFGSQPERRFIPGFTICGSIMRLWVFDRSGPYNSKKFDIHKEPERFVRVIAGYTLMTDAELGLNTFIKCEGNSKYIVTRGVKISQEDHPIASQKAIVCRGTTCYRGRRRNPGDWEHVVKFAWTSDKRPREGDLLKLAKERGVKGIAQWFHHEQITIDGNPDSIAHLRRGMKFGTPRKLSSRASWVDGSSVEFSQAYSRARSLRRSRSSAARPGIRTSPSRQKRKRDEESVDGSGKRSRSIESRSNVEITEDTERRELGTTGHSVQEAEPARVSGCESETYGNRIHYCLVVSPAGQPLHAYRSVGELLEALRDAIRGHKSLLEDGKILHRDISENNIIIIEAATEGDPKGMLIDLDLAKELDSLPSGAASHRTGTRQFMAIEVLQGKGHTYRHDLESFFYVFIWMCIRYGYEDTGNGVETAARGEHRKRARPTTTSILRDWYTGNYSQIANTKLGHMDKNGFENVVSEFAPKFEELKKLARELRTVLFPIKDGAIFTGTFRDCDIMYNGMINTFTRAIDNLRKKE